MEERKLTEKESLEVITSMIARTKDRYIGDGNILLMWGYMIVLISIIVWVLLAITGQPVWNWLWFLIPLVGGIATPIMARKEQNRNGVKTFYDIVTSKLWMIAGLSEFVMILVSVGLQLLSGVSCWSAMLVYTMIAIPFAEIAQGLLFKEKSLVAGGMTGLAVGIITVCCVSGGITLWVYWYMPLFIIGMIAMMIIPGHILNNKKRKGR